MRLPTIHVGTRWIVEIRHVMHGARAVLDDLGRYVHRTAIGDRAIIGCDDETVTFRHRESRTHEQKTMTGAAVSRAKNPRGLDEPGFVQQAY